MHIYIYVYMYICIEICRLWGGTFFSVHREILQIPVFERIFAIFWGKFGVPFWAFFWYTTLKRAFSAFFLSSKPPPKKSKVVVLGLDETVLVWSLPKVRNCVSVHTRLKGHPSCAQVSDALVSFFTYVMAQKGVLQERNTAKTKLAFSNKHERKTKTKQRVGSSLHDLGALVFC